MKIRLSYETEQEKQSFFDAMAILDKDWNLKRLKDPKPKEGQKRKYIYIQFENKVKRL